MRITPPLLLAGCTILALGCGEVVREPSVAGSFYPAEPSELSAMVEGFLANSSDEQIGGPVRALIVPHAGYIYSGQVAARGYRLLEDRYRRVFILASNHNRDAPPFRFSVSNATYYETPLGRVRVSSIAAELLRSELLSYVPEAHATHVIEVHLPLLQKILTRFEIIPIVTGQASREELEAVARLLSPYLDEETLLIASSDLSHYHPYEQAVVLDRRCIEAIEARDMDGVARCEACGLPAMLVLMKLAGERGWGGRVIDYRNSGDTAGTMDRVVGYSAIVFRDEDLEIADKRLLLEISRKALESHITSGLLPEIDASALPERLRRKQGCFVTLEIDHRLRGCIGHIVPQEPLYRCVIENTVNAASHDRRFRPVSRDELGEINIEVSALSVPAPFEGGGPERLLDFLKPLTHGVILRAGSRQSTFLPQVWEQLPEKEEYLSELCLKGGLAFDCWRDPRTEVFTYRATVFDESLLASR